MKTLVNTRNAHFGFWKSTKGHVILLRFLMLISTIVIQAYIGHDQSQACGADELQPNLEVARAVANNFKSFVQDMVHSELVIGLALAASSIGFRLRIPQSLVFSGSIRAH